MITLTVRTDKPEAEIGLYHDHQQIASKIWTAHRQLAETLHIEIANILSLQGLALKDIAGIVCYQGPGSFTGLRIGLSVANALAYSLGIPIIGSTDEEWTLTGINKLQAGENEISVVPEYGNAVYTTQPRK